MDICNECDSSALAVVKEFGKPPSRFAIGTYGLSSDDKGLRIIS